MSDLNKVNDLLFAQLDRLSNGEFTPEQIEHESRRTESMVKISEQILDGANTQIQAMKIVAEYGDKFAGAVPMIGIGGKS